MLGYRPFALAGSLNYAMFGFIGVIANVALLVSLFRTRKDNPPFNKTLASLGVANFISGVFFAMTGTIFSYSNTTGKLKLEQERKYFKLLFFTKGIIMIALSHIVFIAMQRFIAVNFPLHSRRLFTTKLTWLYISLTWLIAIAIFLLSWLVDGKDVLEKDRLVPYAILIFGFVLIVCYASILISLRFQNRISGHTRHSMRLLLNSVGVTLLFLILVCPYAISSLKGDDAYLRYLVSSLIPFRTVIDPLIYFFVSFCCKRSKRLAVQRRDEKTPQTELQANTLPMDLSTSPSRINVTEF